MEENNNYSGNVSMEKDNHYTLKFHGSGKEYFGIIIVNWLLTLVTLGIYYPWARARKIKYLYGSTSLADDRFTFTGTGKEMFRGFVKLLLFYVGFILIIFIVSAISGASESAAVITMLIAYLFLLAIIPLIIHGAYRYRLSRTAWRGIRFGYRGKKVELFKNFFKGLAMTIVTFGIYAAWFDVNLRKYIIGNVRYGDAAFKYVGKGKDLFIIILKGYLLSVITFGIYLFWLQKDIWNYYIDNLVVEKDGKSLYFKSSVSGGDLFALIFTNFLLTICSFGLAFAWVEIRTQRYFIENIDIYGNANLSDINQTEEVYTNAALDDAGDFFDIDIF
jgi:uncharacterized membrane protein YjgN (DUF898 family)